MTVSELIAFLQTQPQDLQVAMLSEELCSWVSVDDIDRLPQMGMPVWLYEPGRRIWVGARDETSDGWLWGNTYGSHYYAETGGGNGTWRCNDNEVDDDYSPTHWMSLPAPPQDLPPCRDKNWCLVQQYPGQIVYVHDCWRLVYVSTTDGRHEFFAEQAQRTRLSALSFDAAKKSLIELVRYNRDYPA